MLDRDNEGNQRSVPQLVLINTEGGSNIFVKLLGRDPKVPTKHSCTVGRESKKDGGLFQFKLYERDKETANERPLCAVELLDYSDLASRLVITIDVDANMKMLVELSLRDGPTVLEEVTETLIDNYELCKFDKCGKQVRIYTVDD